MLAATVVVARDEHVVVRLDRDAFVGADGAAPRDADDGPPSTLALAQFSDRIPDERRGVRPDQADLDRRVHDALAVDLGRDQSGADTLDREDVVRAGPERRRLLLGLGDAHEDLHLVGERSGHRDGQQRGRVVVDGDDQRRSVADAAVPERRRFGDVADHVGVRVRGLVDGRHLCVRGQRVDGRRAALTAAGHDDPRVPAAGRHADAPERARDLVDLALGPGDDEHRVRREPFVRRRRHPEFSVEPGGDERQVRVRGDGGDPHPDAVERAVPPDEHLADRHLVRLVLVCRRVDGDGRRRLSGQPLPDEDVRRDAPVDADLRERLLAARRLREADNAEVLVGLQRGQDDAPGVVAGVGYQHPSPGDRRAIEVVRLLGVPVYRLVAVVGEALRLLLVRLDQDVVDALLLQLVEQHVRVAPVLRDDDVVVLFREPVVVIVSTVVCSERKMGCGRPSIARIPQL